MDWTRITDPDDAVRLLPAWFSGRMIRLHGTFGLLLTTGDVVRFTSIVAVHLSSTGLVLLDVILDSAGVPDGVDLAWRSKHFLGVPVPAATLATINLTHVVAVVDSRQLSSREGRINGPRECRMRSCWRLAAIPRPRWPPCK